MQIFHTHISEKSKKLVNEVLDSTFISAGKMADEFELQLEERLGLINPVTVNSGTSALYLALAVAGVSTGDEVILPAQTFIASGLSILMHNAKPVFADIQYATGNIDPDSIRSKITAKTKAIMPVHWAGYPCDMDEINAIANEHNVAVIEDAAHALGATYKGKSVGALSRFTALSFQAVKHLTTGDGGALCCLNAEDLYQAKRRRWFDIDRDNAQPGILGDREYDAVSVGYKLHMNDLSAALGLGNLDDFPDTLKRRREIAGHYIREFKNVPGISLLEYRDDRECAYWIFTMKVEKRLEFIKKLRAGGIPASIIHLRIDDNSVFGGITPGLPGQEKFNEDQVSLPVHNGLSDDDIETIINTVKLGW
ncbi:MAG: DegT/DnrJ/EryC1/StrS family aminotransferase [Nitrospira sp.]|nr:DegT/DnrJ/EryC1/StrS family aminotransferase [Nitrospira sp.]